MQIKYTLFLLLAATAMLSACAMDDQGYGPYGEYGRPAYAPAGPGPYGSDVGPVYGEPSGPAYYNGPSYGPSPGYNERPRHHAAPMERDGRAYRSAPRARTPVDGRVHKKVMHPRRHAASGKTSNRAEPAYGATPTQGAQPNQQPVQNNTNVNE